MLELICNPSGWPEIDQVLAPLPPFANNEPKYCEPASPSPSVVVLTDSGCCRLIPNDFCVVWPRLSVARTVNDWKQQLLVGVPVIVPFWLSVSPVGSTVEPAIDHVIVPTPPLAASAAL